MSPTLLGATTAPAAPAHAAAANRGEPATASFAALFDLSPPAPTTAEPAALPSASTHQREAEPAPETNSPDPGLLAALGLEPLPALQPTAPWPGLLAAGVVEAAVVEAGGEEDALLASRNARVPRLTAAETAAALAALTKAGAAPANLAQAPEDAALPSTPSAPLANALPSTTAPARSGDANAATPAPDVALAAALRGLLSPAAAGGGDSIALDPQALAGLPAAARPAADFSAPAAPPPGLATAIPASALPLQSESGVDPAALEALAPAEAATGKRAESPVATAAVQGGAGAEFGALLRESLQPLAALAPPGRLDTASPQFSAALGQQVVWMASQQLGRAEIRLSPEELGPLEIGLELNGDEIRAEFASRSAEVRSLLETQVPRLRELLAEQGFSLADAQVGQERAAYQDAPQQREASATRGDRPAAEPAEVADGPAGPAIRIRQGLIDDFA